MTAVIITITEQLRRCNICLKEKTLGEFHKLSRFPLGHVYTCIKCSNELSANRYEKNKVEICKKRREEHRRLKQEVIKGYGGKCECCGESEWQFLTLDHKNGGGTAERRLSNNRNHTVFYKRLLANGCPREKFRLLCWNCNSSFGLYGKCPHKESF